MTKEEKADYNKVYYQAHKAEKSAYGKAYYAANKEKWGDGYTRRNHLRRRYGISVDQYEELFEKQGRACAICRSVAPRSKKPWHLDHCHSTGTVRGVLCHHCNVMLGNAGDSIPTLLSGADYLRHHHDKGTQPTHV